MSNLIPNDWRVIFQVGELDFSYNEFALAPSEARSFKEKFPQDPVYIVGKSEPKEFPFIHPNEADTLWGGDPHHSFRIKFNISKEPEGEILLFLALADVHESLPPFMEVHLNEKLVGRKKVQAGAGKAFFGEKGEEQVVAFPIEKDNLKVGENELVISLSSGSWVAYDAIYLFEIPRTNVPLPK
ncbi:MAG: polysaccharide lyase family protein, partial [bacterium]